jgi:hypothetical protein
MGFVHVGSGRYIVTVFTVVVVPASAGPASGPQLSNGYIGTIGSCGGGVPTRHLARTRVRSDDGV